MKRAFTAALVLLICGLSALAQRGTSAIDPYRLNTAASPGVFNQNTKAVSLRSQLINPAIRNLIIVAAGQSNITNIAPTAYTPANPSALDNLNIFDGAVYAAADPLLGTSLNIPYGPGHPLLRVADAWVSANKFDRVIITPIAIDGTLVAQYATGGTLSEWLPVTFRRLAAKGFVAGTNVTVIVAWGQGESDKLAGTSQADYTNSLNDVIAISRSSGFAGTWFVAKQTYSGGISAAVQAAQAAVVNHGAAVWAGANADALIGTACGGSACRIGDDTHWADAGSLYYAAAWSTAFAAFGPPF